MENATLRTWDDQKGFGFADPDSGGTSVFVHCRAFNEGNRPVRGSRLEIDVEMSEKGPRARKAWVIGENE